MFVVALPVMPAVFVVYSIGEQAASQGPVAAHRAMTARVSVRCRCRELPAAHRHHHHHQSLHNRLHLPRPHLYFPEMDGVERVWATVILEHLLFLCKLLVENIVPKEPTAAIDAYQQAQDKKRALLDKCGIDKEDQY